MWRMIRIQRSIRPFVAVQPRLRLRSDDVSCSSASKLSTFANVSNNCNRGGIRNCISSSKYGMISPTHFAPSSFPFSTSSAFATSTPETNDPSSKDDDGDASNSLNLKPSQVVAGLNLHIVGQEDAKRAVAIAMRNRWRRSQLNDAMRKEITPRNVLLIGPTGCGKTEVARRMSLLNQAPFLKVEATKFTEVGYHGRDVDSIIRDLMDVSMQLTRTQYTQKLTAQAKLNVTEVILNQLAGPAAAVVTPTKAPGRKASTAKTSAIVEASATTTATAADTAEDATKVATNDDTSVATTNVATSSTTDPSAAAAAATKANTTSTNRGRESFREMLLQGMLDDQEIEVEIPKGFGEGGSSGSVSRNANVDTSSTGSSNDQVTAAVTELWARMSGQGSGGSSGKRTSGSVERKRLPISVARDVLEQVELEKLLDAVDLKQEAINAVQESGIVFIDEIDKICSSRHDSYGKSADASAEGVQRDLLPLIEGTTISTKYGNVNTDYILFIASGAFHAVKPSDLLPELQGRLPIRVELKGLTEHDLYRILTEPVANLIKQQQDLIGTEGVSLSFDDAAIREIARMAHQLNATVENIGARRLHTVLERIMEDLSFDAAEMEAGSTLVVTKQLVEQRLADVVQTTDISKYIL